MSKILVADDEMIERRVLVKRLRTHCGETCGILEAENGKARILESDRVYYDPSLIVDHYKSVVRS